MPFKLLADEMFELNNFDNSMSHIVSVRFASFFVCFISLAMSSIETMSMHKKGSQSVTFLTEHIASWKNIHNSFDSCCGGMDTEFIANERRRDRILSDIQVDPRCRKEKNA